MLVRGLRARRGHRFWSEHARYPEVARSLILPSVSGGVWRRSGGHGRRKTCGGPGLCGGRGRGPLMRWLVWGKAHDREVRVLTIRHVPFFITALLDSVRSGLIHAPAKPAVHANDAFTPQAALAPTAPHTPPANAAAS